MPSIPEQYQTSRAMQFIVAQGWNFKPTTPPTIELETCPYCNKAGWGHFYMEVHADDDEEKNRDGLHSCKKCAKGGNLNSLKQKLGMAIAGVEGRKDWAGNAKTVEPLPDTDALHDALMADEAAMDYLVNERGFSIDIIQKQKLGLKEKHYFRETGEVRALVYPYLVNGNTVWVHYRTLPTMPISDNKVIKAFSSPSGWDSTLYNGTILLPGLTDLVMVEGEPNVIAALDHGIDNIVGVPGANIKKAQWIDTLDSLGLSQIFICYDKDKVGQRAAQDLATRIGIERCWKIILPDFEVTTEEGVVRPGKDLNEWFVSGGGTKEGFDQLKQAATLFGVEGVSDTGDSVQEFLEEIKGKGAVEPKYKSPWDGINRWVGFDDGDVIDILAPEKVGKFLKSDSLALMENGKWKRHDELKKGDRLASIDGEENIVIDVFPQGVQALYKCVFADGRFVLAGGPHLWKVDSVNRWEDGPQVFTTDAIRKHHCSMGHHSSKVFVPLINGKFGKNCLPIDPWVLGAMIGDGSMCGSSGKFTTIDEELAQRLKEKLENSGSHLNLVGEHRDAWRNGHVKAGPSTKSFTVSGQFKNDATMLGMWEHRANTKFIPQVYLEADKESRWELLRGLMDTDGTAGNKNGTPSYCTVSKQLAEDFVYLVRSLGGMAKVTKPQKKSFRYKGELRSGQDAYIIVVRFPAGVRKDVFSLERKKALVNCKDKNNDPRLTFTSIEYAGEHEAVCIAVSHPSKLYVTDDFIVTHNTTFALNLVEHMVNTYGDDGVIICLEMTRARMARKWICHKAQIADNIPQNEIEAKELYDDFINAIPKVQDLAANREGELYFCYPQYKTMEDLYGIIRQIIRRYGVKWIVFDNIQRAADTTSSAKGSNRTEHLSQISKVLSQMAKDYNVNMVRILQPNRVGKGQIVSTDNVDGSSQIAKDCDCMITLHREKQGEMTVDQFAMAGHVDEGMSFSPTMLASIGLSRYSGGGRTTLYYDGARSTINEKPVDEIAKIKAQAEAKASSGHAQQLADLGIPTGKVDPMDETIIA